MIDFEKDVNIDVKDDALKDISELSQKLVDLEDEASVLEKAVKKWGWNERIACILVWPLGFVAFFGSLILSFFRK